MMKPRKVRKAGGKKLSKPSGYTHFSTVEKDLLAKLQASGKTPSQVAVLMGRDLSAVCRHFKRNEKKSQRIRPVGQPPALTEKQKDRVVFTMEKMVAAADSKYQVTAGMVRCGLKLQCSDRVIRDTLHSRGVTFHPMREKPVRTEEDEKARYSFGKKYCPKPKAFWRGKVHAFLDNKVFPVYLNGAARAYAAKRTARGSFRQKGQGLAKGHVKPRKGLKMNYGKNVMVAVAISAQRVLMCYHVKGHWNGAKAAEMYSRHLAPALRKTHPTKKRFLLLEDNDPAGYKSNLGKDAKRAERIDVLPLPKRSPDLNPLDYGFWDCVNRRLREQESRFQTRKKETPQQFTARLRRTIMRTPKEVLTPMVESMKRRCVALKACGGKDFEE